MEYLDKEKQYNKILNDSDIRKIEDCELRSIRMKYWRLKHESFLDEYNISDSKLMDEWERLSKKEFEEIDDYKRNLL